MGLISRRHAALVAVGAMAMSCLWAAPASAASALVVTPNTDLVDFQTVTVDGSGFSAEHGPRGWCSARMASQIPPPTVT